MTVEELPKEFIGVGEVLGFKFTQLNKSNTHYLYEVDIEGSKHYEIVERMVVPKCIDFNTKTFSDEEFKETYPRANLFGVNAYTLPTLKFAENKFNELNAICITE